MRMDFPWEFFEELGEMVYVSDVETNTLVYMNAYLRNALGYQSHEEYVGKKCYHVLQGNDSQCHFCNNCKLKPGEFITWTYKNPIMDRRFLVKDSMLCQDGKTLRQGSPRRRRTQGLHPLQRPRGGQGNR